MLLRNFTKAQNTSKLNPLTTLSRNFTVYSNQPARDTEQYGQKKFIYDYSIHSYPAHVKVFLEKRFIHKDEIWPKMYITQPIQSTINSLATQTLPYLRDLEHVDEIGAQKERGRLGSQFILNVMMEDYFKPFLDEVSKKYVMNGDTVPMKDAQKDKELKKKVVDLYHQFHFGSEMTPLERQVENDYLGEKIEKYVSWGRTGVSSQILNFKNSSNIVLETDLQECMDRH